MNRFDQIAATWDQNPQRVKMASGIAQAMARELVLRPDQILLDYGTGTGLIALNLLPQVGKVIAVDPSQGMIDALRAKITPELAGRFEIVRGSAEENLPPLPPVDVIVSSMVFHHIRNIAAALRALAGALKPGGQLAIADLDEDQGLFHDAPQGVYHNGFSRVHLRTLAEGAGFNRVGFTDAYALAKKTAHHLEKTFTVFLLTAVKS